MVEKIFNLNADYVRNQCEPRDVQCDSNTPFYPEKDFWEVLTEGVQKLPDTEESQKFFRNAFGDGSGI